MHPSALEQAFPRSRFRRNRLPLRLDLVELALEVPASRDGAVETEPCEGDAVERSWVFLWSDASPCAA